MTSRTDRWLRRLVLGLALAGLAPAPASAATRAKATKLQRLYSKSAKPLPAGPLMTTQEGSAHLDKAHYEDVRDAALALMEKYPPAKHYYLALGRSPVSIYTFLKALDNNKTSTFPASDLRMGIETDTHRAFFAHFEKYIPKDVLAGKRGAIVLYDRSHDRSGTSLAAIKPVLEKYLKRQGYKTKVIAVGFAGQGPLVEGVAHISTAKFPGVFRYYSGSDEDENVATYVGHHTIGQDAVNQLQSNPQHRQFEKQMINRMSRDEKLDTALRTKAHLKGQ